MAACPSATPLGNSFNIPAIKTELWNGVAKTVVRTAYSFGIGNIYRDNSYFGYATTIGGMEHGVKLVQETSALWRLCHQRDQGSAPLLHGDNRPDYRPGPVASIS